MGTRTTFVIPKMDCPSEERLIRMALEPVEGIERLEFDLDGRTLDVVHADGLAEVALARLEPLGFGTRLVGSRPAPDAVPGSIERSDTAGEARVLWQLLAINGTMFVLELGLGLWGQSTGLVADSLDMLADALVYGVSIYAVGRAPSSQQRAARISGMLQLVLALGVLGEVGRRSISGSEPIEAAMVGVGALALAANLACVALLARHRQGGVHLKASWIFTTNDAIANLAVMVAGGLVWWTGSPIPDLVVGTAVGLLVLSGAVRILRMTSKPADGNGP